jgi:murein DD-endopeptidase MepM/ murein hydrolase activator NlpD
VSEVLQHLGMGLGLGALGCLLVIGVRGSSDDAPPRVDALAAAIETPVDARADAPPPVDAGPGDAPSEAAVSAPPPPPEPPLPPPIFRVASLLTDPSVVLADGTLGKRPFLNAVAAAGLGLRESYRVLHAIGKVHNMHHTSPTDSFHFAKQKSSGKVVAFEYVTSPIDVFQAVEDGGALLAKKLDLHVELRRVAVPVIVTADLKVAVIKAGLREDILQRIDDALDGHAELADIRPGSRLRVIATEQRLEGVFQRYAALDALEYAPANQDAPLRVYRFPPLDRDKAAQSAVTHAGTFYDARGQQPYHGGWRIPVPGARIASRFNMHRMHPVLHVVMPHNGVDFAAPAGTPIYAAASGTVKSVGDSGPCGNMVQIEHGTDAQSLITAYCHMSRFAAGLHPGEHVETRQLIGYVGQTGRATGPHLHFALKRNGVFVDPLTLKLDGVRVVPAGQRDEFDVLRGSLDKALDSIAIEPVPTPSADAGPATVVADAGNQVDGGGEEPIFDENPLP